MYGPDEVRVELSSNEGNMLNLNFISAIAQMPKSTNIISAVRRITSVGIIAPVIARYIMEAICIRTRQTENNLYKALKNYISSNN